jgi:hypothetical protein
MPPTQSADRHRISKRQAMDDAPGLVADLDGRCHFDMPVGASWLMIARASLRLSTSHRPLRTGIAASTSPDTWLSAQCDFEAAGGV